MTIPDTIKVGRLTYQVKEGEQAHHDNSKCWGLTDHEKQIILLDPSMNEERQAETFLHELMHVAMSHCGLSSQLSDNAKLTEEDFIRGTTTALYMILKDNNIQF